MSSKNGFFLFKPKVRILIFILAVLFFSMDDEINPKAEAILNSFDTQYNLSDNGSVYQLGMWEGIDLAPYEIGLRKITKCKEYLSNIDEYGFYSANGVCNDFAVLRALYQDNNRPKLLCDFRELECLDYAYKNSGKASELILDNQKYIEEYEGLMKYNDFSLYAKPSNFYPTNHLGPNLDVLKLKLLPIFQKAKAKEYYQAATMLTELMSFNKKILENTPYIGAKADSLIELELILGAGSYLLSKTEVKSLNEWSIFIDELKPMTGAQVSYQRQNMFYFAAIVEDLDRRKLRGLNEILGFPDFFYDFIRPLLYKRNRTINSLYDVFSINEGRVSFVDGVISATEMRQPYEFLSWDYKNLEGSYISMLVMPMLLELEEESYEFEIKQRMIKHQFYNEELSVLDNNYKYSDFLGNGTFIFKDNQMCVAPYEKEKLSTCVYVF